MLNSSIFIIQAQIILLFANSLNIFTPQDYALFKNGHLSRDVTAIKCFPSAGCSFPEISQYASSVDITFMEGNGNMINTFARSRKVQAFLVNGQSFLEFLPHDFSTYSITINGGTIVTPADVNAILQWKSAKMIQITDNKNLALTLLLHINEFNKNNVKLLVASS